MHLSDLKQLPVTELVEMAITNDIEGASRLRKHDLIFALLKTRVKKANRFQAMAPWKFCRMVSVFALSGYFLSGRSG